MHFRLFPELGSCELDMCEQVFLWTYIFISPGSNLKKGRDGVWHEKTVNFGGKAGMFGKAATANSMWELTALQLCQYLVISVFLMLVLAMGVEWLLPGT